MRALILLFLALALPSLGQSLSQPTNVNAVATGATTVTVTWTASTATGIATPAITYVVTRTGGSGGTFTSNLLSATTFSDTALTPGTSYTYRVQAFTLNGENSVQSIISEPDVVSTPAAPSTPANLRATLGTNSVVLAWDAVSGATTYTIYRNGEEIDDATGTTFTDTEVELATTYRYTVSATTPGGESDESNLVTITTKGDGSQREAVWTREFNRADGNFDGAVTFEEYLVAFPQNSLSWVIMINRFNTTDDDISGDLTVDEYIEHFAGKTVKRPSKAQTFFLADLDGDDLLDPAEYSLTLNRGTKPAAAMKKFNKLNKDRVEDEVLSQREFGIRYGTAELPEE
jgi:hypothetical protein